jgi:hypothetical protein
MKRAAGNGPVGMKEGNMPHIVFTLIMAFLAVIVLSLQSAPVLIGGLTVACGAMLIYSLRRRLLDVDAAVIGYVLASAAVHFAR